MSHPAGDDLLNREQLAHKLGEYVRGRPYSPTTLKLWARQRRGPPFSRIGNAIVYKWSLALKWVNDGPMEG